MKITFIPTGNAPSHYSFNGEIITAHCDDGSESFDLSQMAEGGQFTGLQVDTLPLPAPQIIRSAYRDETGELHVTLCQRVGAGHWESGGEINADQYNPDKVQVVYRKDRKHAGVPTAHTRLGRMTVKQKARSG